MRHRNTRFEFLVLILLLPAWLPAQQADTLRVLFVGNSFTYYWNLPQVVQAMAKSQGSVILTRQSTSGGASLEDHWKGAKGLKTKALIEAGGWDYVVLQDHSLQPINAPETFMEYGKKFGELARSVGAAPLYFMTWAYASNPLMQGALTEGYAKLATEMQADVIPVGPLWTSVRQLRPDLDLFFDDKHPTPEGTYLTGLAFFKKLTGKVVSKIPERLSTTDLQGEHTYLLFVLPEDAVFLRQCADMFDLGNTVQAPK
ncbi:MAG: hypothetical protein EP344_02460 [Bacteroidetes bacterium]|nr:MAG: hypothetical protein EP344_02460 [Bacteroidota bacterium]